MKKLGTFGAIAAIVVTGTGTAYKLTQPPVYSIDTLAAVSYEVKQPGNPHEVLPRVYGTTHLGLDKAIIFIDNPTPDQIALLDAEIPESTAKTVCRILLLTTDRASCFDRESKWQEFSR